MVGPMDIRSSPADVCRTPFGGNVRMYGGVGNLSSRFDSNRRNELPYGHGLGLRHWGIVGHFGAINHTS
eukprot:6021057-Lingulodinium_polyedra.AAC.1